MIHSILSVSRSILRVPVYESTFAYKMKFAIALILINLLILSELGFGETSEALDKCVENNDKNLRNVYSLSELFANSVTRTINQFSANLQKWDGYLISFSKKDDFLQPNITLDFVNYVISFSNVSISSVTGNFHVERIGCEFKDNVKLILQQKEPKDFKLKGEIYMGIGQSRNNTVIGTYEMSIKNLSLTYIEKQNSSPNYQWPNPKVQTTNITYNAFDIALAVYPEYSSIPTPETDALVKYTKSSLQSKITEALSLSTNGSLIFRNLFTICMNGTRDQNFHSLDQYNYIIENQVGVSSRLKLSSVGINRLSHIKGIEIAGDQNTYNFTLTFYDMAGYIKWIYRLHEFDSNKSAKLKFKTDNLTIEGILRDEQIHNIIVRFKPTYVCSQFNNTIQVTLREKVSEFPTSAKPEEASDFD